MNEKTISVARLKPRKKRYQVVIGKGLVVRVQPSGVKSWIVRLPKNGRIIDVTIGHYPELSIAQAKQIARQKRTEFSLEPPNGYTFKDAFDEISARCNAIEKWVSELNQNIQARINALQSNVLSLKEPLSAAYNEINRLKNSVEIIDRQEMANKATIKEIDERLSKVEDYLNNDEKLMWPRIYTIVAAVIIFLAFGLAIGLLK